MQVLFYISLGFTALGFVMAVLIFFLYDIPTIYAIRSGKQEKRAVAGLNRRSAKVGNFGGKRPASQNNTASANSAGQGTKTSTGGTSKDLRRKVKKLRVEQNSEELNRPNVLQETELLGQDSLSVMAVQYAAPKGDTMPLRVEIPQKEESQTAGMTVDLADADPAQQSVPNGNTRRVPPGFTFEILEDIVVCDTQERI